LTFRTTGPKLIGMSDDLTPRALLALWPSLEAISDDTGASLFAVRKWPQRDRIPSEWWSALVRSAGERGINEVTFEALAEAHARRPVEMVIEARA
jgi:hypothetical protein